MPLGINKMQENYLINVNLSANYYCKFQGHEEGKNIQGWMDSRQNSMEQKSRCQSHTINEIHSQRVMLKEYTNFDFLIL